MAPDGTASPDWSNLGKRLRDARGTRTGSAVYAATGVAPNTITAWEHGKNTAASPALYKLIEFYEWPSGALDRVLAGGTPETPDVPMFQITSDELAAVLQELPPEQQEMLLRAVQRGARNGA